MSLDDEVRIFAEEEPPVGFDTRVEIRDSRTGKIKAYQPYTLHIKGGTRIFERNGKKYWENGKEISLEEYFSHFPDERPPAPIEVSSGPIAEEVRVLPGQTADISQKSQKVSSKEQGRTEAA